MKMSEEWPGYPGKRCLTSGGSGCGGREGSRKGVEGNTNPSVVQYIMHHSSRKKEGLDEETRIRGKSPPHLSPSFIYIMTTRHLVYEKPEIACT